MGAVLCGSDEAVPLAFAVYPTLIVRTCQHFQDNFLRIITTLFVPSRIFEQLFVSGTDRTDSLQSLSVTPLSSVVIRYNAYTRETVLQAAEAGHLRLHGIIVRPSLLKDSTAL